MGVLQVGAVATFGPNTHNQTNCNVHLERGVSRDPRLGRAAVQNEWADSLCSLKMRACRQLPGCGCGVVWYTLSKFIQQWPRATVESVGLGHLVPKQGLWKAFCLTGAAALAAWDKHVCCVLVTYRGEHLSAGVGSLGGALTGHEDQLFKDSG